MMGESRACHRSPVEAPVLLPQLRRGRLRLLFTIIHRRVAQYTPRRGLGRHVSERHCSRGDRDVELHLCQRPSTTANARHASSYAPSSLDCSAWTERRRPIVIRTSFTINRTSRSWADRGGDGCGGNHETGSPHCATESQELRVARRPGRGSPSCPLRPAHVGGRRHRARCMGDGRFLHGRRRGSNGAFIEHWDGRSWRVAQAPIPAGANLWSISASGRADVRPAGRGM